MLDSLILHRPLIFFDIETTGTSIVKDRIVELCAIKIAPDKSRIEVLQRFNPGIKIPYEVSQIHGITNEMVKNEPAFADTAQDLASFFSGCDLAGFNIAKFDIPLLVEEFLRTGLDYNPVEGAKIVDAMTIFMRKEPRNLEAALKFYANEELKNAHSAHADVEATIKVLNGQLQKYSDLKPSTDSLHEFSASQRVDLSTKYAVLDYDGKFARDKSGNIIFTFGKNKGLLVSENLGMLEWMLNKDFSEHTKFIARKILKGVIK